VRIDKFLKNARLIKRRTVAKEACEKGKILINDKVAKPGSQVEPGDIVILQLGARQVKIKVKDIREHVNKGDAELLYEEI
jgi:ribosomal 50S subunit-recycling heat shock protein